MLVLNNVHLIEDFNYDFVNDYLLLEVESADRIELIIHDFRTGTSRKTYMELPRAEGRSFHGGRHYDLMIACWDTLFMVRLGRGSPT